jgi:hypothetical protein
VIWGANVVWDDPALWSTAVIWGADSIGVSNGNAVIWGATNGLTPQSVVWGNLADEGAGAAAAACLVVPR